MANTVPEHVGQGELLGRGELDWDKEAWEFLTHWPYDAENLYDNFATVQPAETSTRGATVHFTFTHYLDEVTQSLDEYEDVDTVAMESDYITLTLLEYGNAVRDTRFLQETSFIPLNPQIARAIGQNAGRSIDTLARDVMHDGLNVKYSGSATSRATVSSDDTLEASSVRRTVARFRANSVPPFGGMYVASIHPDVSVDFREETDAAAWREPHVYGQTQERIFAGEVGAFEGVRFIEHARAKVREGEGDGGDNVYDTLVFGAEALAKGFAPGVGPQPTVVQGPVTDTLRRFVPVGWYWLGGYRIFRQESIVRIESGSSVDSSEHSTTIDDDTDSA